MGAVARVKAEKKLEELRAYWTEHYDDIDWAMGDEAAILRGQIARLSTALDKPGPTVYVGGGE